MKNETKLMSNFLKDIKKTLILGAGSTKQDDLRMSIEDSSVLIVGNEVQLCFGKYKIVKKHENGITAIVVIKGEDVLFEKLYFTKYLAKYTKKTLTNKIIELTIYNN